MFILFTCSILSHNYLYVNKLYVNKGFVSLFTLKISYFLLKIFLPLSGKQIVNHDKNKNSSTANCGRC